MSDEQPQDIAARVIVLARGVMEKGGFYWCYVAVKPSRYDEFKLATANKYNIQDFVQDGYGEVIVSGEGREPTKLVTEKVAEIFGVSAESLFRDEDPLGTIDKTIAAIQAEQA